MLQWWTTHETHKASSYFARNPASGWEFNDYASYSAQYDQVTTATQAHLNWIHSLTTIKDSKWTPRSVVEQCEALLSQEEDLRLAENLFSTQADQRISRTTHDTSQATLSSVQSSIAIRNEAREAAGAASRKRKQPTDDEASDTVKSRTRSSSSWQQYARKPWKTANHLIFNMALSSDRDNINGEALKSLMNVEGLRELDRDGLEDMEGPLNTFRHVHSLEILHPLLN
ncbi:hypothetical protein BGZ65_009344 [Modicella reniformis]|uniref:Uncharacterized protein n=1 Tax=Modicella reniformis TaxID=1440133 RepID=A0A9P6LWB9_9FUNG|nr:hypothetical protein BGZ65_009344 [Modicella reniformis]